MEECSNEEKQKKATLGEFVRAEHKEGSTAMETLSGEEFVNEEVTGEESTAVQTPSMEESVNEENQVEGTSSIDPPPPWRNLLMKKKNNMVNKNKNS